MCSDTNWKLRKKGAEFLFNFLQPVLLLKKKKSKEEVKTPSHAHSLSKASSFRSMVVQSPQIPTPIIKVTKTRFKEHFLPTILELVADEEPMVQIEGINLMTEYMSVIKKDSIENEFIPNLEKLMT